MKTYSNIKEFVDSKKAVSIYDQEYEEYVSSIETHVFSETVSLFLNDVSNSKLFDLDAKVFHASSYLPHSLKSEFLKHEILKINLELEAFNTIRINDIKGDYDGAFLKDLVELVFDENYSFNCYMKIKSNQQFIGVYNSCDGDMEKIFPCFDKITNNLALLKHYQGLLSNYDEILSGGTIKNPYIVRFMINLADTKLINLFNSLITNTFIDENTKEDNFIWAFGGENDKTKDWQPIYWIDKSITRPEPNIQTLYELLFLLGVKDDTDSKSINNIYRKIEFCFKGLKNISVKNPHRTNNTTPRFTLLKEIVKGTIES